MFNVKTIVQTRSVGWVFCLCAGAAPTALQAQTNSVEADWKESAVPAPPVFNADKLLPLEMPHYVSLQLGIDPTTLSITPEGIVRYVVVARNASGSVTAMYEGIRCATGEVKTYARASSAGAWSVAQNQKWRGLTDNQPSKHALAFARQGACDGGSTVASTTADIIKVLSAK